MSRRRQTSWQAMPARPGRNAFKPTAAAADLSEAYPWDNVTLRDSGFGNDDPDCVGGHELSYMDNYSHRRDGALLFDMGGSRLRRIWAQSAR